MGAFDPCSLIVQLGKLLGLLSLASGLKRFIRFAPPQGEGPSP